MTLELPSPDLTDGRITLRQWNYEDLDCIEAASDEGIIPEGTTVPRSFTLQAGRDFVTRQRDRYRSGEGWSFAISTIPDDIAVGCIVLMDRPQKGVAGIGYWLVPEARGRGYATKAVKLLSDWGSKDAGLTRIEAWVEPGNEASRAVLEKSGFEYEGRLRSFLAFPGRRADALVYSRLPDADRTEKQ